MRPGIPYWIFILFSLVIFTGNAGAHPHELENIDHGPSLGSYMIQLDFTIDDSTKGRHSPNISLAKKDAVRKKIKKDKSLLDKNLDKTRIIKKTQIYKKGPQK